MNIRISSKMLCMAVLLSTGIGFGAFAQQDPLPRTVSIPVTFYDFQASPANPDFEPGQWWFRAPYSAADIDGGTINGVFYGSKAGVKEGMVLQTLDSDRKPVYSGQNLTFNSNLNKWFRPSSAPGASFYFDEALGRWNWSNLVEFGPNQYVGMDYYTNPADPMKNIVIYKSLEFTLYDSLFNTDPRFSDATLLGKGIYVFDDQSFFPIDGMGYGTEPVSYTPYAWTNPGHNYSFTMEIHKEITYHPDLFFTFTGDDDVFAFINGSLVMDLGGIHGPETKTLDLRSLNLTDGEVFTFDFFYAERHVIGSHILIMTNLVAPQGPTSIGLTATPPGDMCAGDIKTLTAAVFNDELTNLTSEYGSFITWTAAASDGNMGGSRLLATTGPTVQFEAQKAHTDYTVTARLAVPEKPGTVLTSSITFAVNACYPAYTIIEPTASPDKWTPVRKDELVITSGVNTGELYAFVRDQFNNLVGPANQSTWSSRDVTIVTAAGAPAGSEIGIVTRVTGTEAQAFVLATDARTPTRPDSVNVRVVPWYPVRLKLVNGLDTAQDLSEGVAMTADQTQPLVVKGLQSNSDTLNGQYIWSVVNVNWNLVTTTIGLAVPTPQSPSDKWTLDPTAPGTGVLQLRHSDTRTAPLDVGVRVGPGAINRIVISIIDTASVRPTAGVPVKASVCIFGTDGAYPVDTCLSLTFGDLLAGSVPGVPATVTHGATTVELTTPVTVCFVGGCAQVSFQIYYAPENKAPHNITVTQTTNPAVTAPSGPFVLSPGPLARLVLEYPTAGHVPIPDTVVMSYPDGVLNVVAMGYDPWNNVRGRELSNWNAGGSLHPPKEPFNRSSQYYDASEVISDEQGLFAAAAISNPAITDGVQIYIAGRGAAVDTAYTRDINANGLLDAIEFHFNTEVVLPRSGNYQNGFTITDIATGTVFVADSLVSRSGLTSDRVWTLYMQEQRTAEPQTSWRPYVQIANVPGVQSIPGATAFRTTDGAGPVIWSVTKYVSVPGDRTKDSVIVRFSEYIYSAAGAQLGNDVLPSDLFNVHRRDASVGGMTELPNILDGISGLTEVRRGRFGTEVKFIMSNGSDLLQTYYVNIDTERANIKDDPATSNVPAIHNQKVKVFQVGTHPDLMSGPNPSSAIFTHKGPGVFTAGHEPHARKWVRNDDRGFLMTFDLVVPTPDNIVRVHIKIYDIAGNLVHSALNNDLVAQYRQALADNNMPDTIDQMTTIPVDMYWNGSTGKGMAAAPGLYRAIVYIDYADNTLYGDRREVTMLGIGR